MEDYFPIGKVTFQGRTVKFQGVFSVFFPTVGKNRKCDEKLKICQLRKIENLNPFWESRFLNQSGFLHRKFGEFWAFPSFFLWGAGWFQEKITEKKGGRCFGRPKKTCRTCLRCLLLLAIRAQGGHLVSKSHLMTWKLPTKIPVNQVSGVHSRAPGWLFDIGDDKLPNYMGIIILLNFILYIYGDYYTTQLDGDYVISQYKDPYKPIRIQWHVMKGFERC